MSDSKEITVNEYSNRLKYSARVRVDEQFEERIKRYKQEGYSLKKEAEKLLEVEALPGFRLQEESIVLEDYQVACTFYGTAKLEKIEAPVEAKPRSALDKILQRVDAKVLLNSNLLTRNEKRELFGLPAVPENKDPKNAD